MRIIQCILYAIFMQSLFILYSFLASIKPLCLSDVSPGITRRYLGVSTVTGLAGSPLGSEQRASRADKLQISSMADDLPFRYQVFNMNSTCA